MYYTIQLSTTSTVLLVVLVMAVSYCMCGTMVIHCCTSVYIHLYEYIQYCMSVWYYGVYV